MKCSLYLPLLVAGTAVSIQSAVADDVASKTGRLASYGPSFSAAAPMFPSSVGRFAAYESDGRRASYRPAMPIKTASTSPAASTGTNTIIPGPTDPRIVASIDPGNALGSYPKSRFALQLGQDTAGQNIQRDVTTFPEPGYLDWKVNQFTVMRGADPANPSKKAFRHKLVKGMSYRQDSGTFGGKQPYQSARASLLSAWSATSPYVLRDGVPYWAAFAIYVGNDHPFDGSGDHIGVLSLGHCVTSRITQSMNKIDLRKDGKLRFWVQSNSVLDGTDATTKGTVFDFPVSKGAWNYIVIQWKYEWDAAKGPYTRLWRAVGNGSPEQIVNTNIANAFRESAGYHPWKYGLYMWDVNNGWGSSSSRTIYTKGLQILKDQSGTPKLDVNSMLALVRSK